MQYSPSWEADSVSASQEILAFKGLKGSLLYSQKPATIPISITADEIKNVNICPWQGSIHLDVSYQEMQEY